MNELSQICHAARDSERLHEPLWLATVVRVKGSAYRHAGSRMLFSSGKVLAGSVSGGCLEASIVRKGPWLARERPTCVRFDGSREEEDDESPRGTGCDGIVEILLERADFAVPGAVLSVIEDCLRNEKRVVIATVHTSRDAHAPVGARLTLDEAGRFCTSALDGPAWSALAQAAERALAEQRPLARTVSSHGFEALLEVIEPAPHLFVIGAGPDATPLVEFASAIGLGVTVCVSSAGVEVRERFAQKAELHIGSMASVAAKLAARRTSVAVIMSHHYPTDQAALAMLLDSPARYIGVLGPRRRTERMLNELFPDREALTGCNPGRIRAPMGLDLGAETPAQIALSVIAEVQTVLARASAEPLSARTHQPIHSLPAELALPSMREFGKTGTA